MKLEDVPEDLARELRTEGAQITANLLFDVIQRRRDRMALVGVKTTGSEMRARIDEGETIYTQLVDVLNGAEENPKEKER